MSTVRTDTTVVPPNFGEVPNAIWREVTSCGFIEWQMEVILTMATQGEFTLVDTVKCVECGFVWHVPTSAKRSQSFNGLCSGEHRNAKVTDGAKAESKALPEGGARSR